MLNLSHIGIQRRKHSPFLSSIINARYEILSVKLYRGLGRRLRREIGLRLNQQML